MRKAVREGIEQNPSISDEVEPCPAYPPQGREDVRCTLLAPISGVKPPRKEERQSRPPLSEELFKWSPRKATLQLGWRGGFSSCAFLVHLG